MQKPSKMSSELSLFPGHILFPLRVCNYITLKPSGFYVKYPVIKRIFPKSHLNSAQKFERGREKYLGFQNPFYITCFCMKRVYWRLPSINYFFFFYCYISRRKYLFVLWKFSTFGFWWICMFWYVQNKILYLDISRKNSFLENVCLWVCDKNFAASLVREQMCSTLWNF